MTAIVGLVEQGKVWIGGDSAATSGWALTVRRDPKVFRVGPYLIGLSGSPRQAQLLRFSLSVPDQDPRHSDEQHMMTTFIGAVRQTLKDGGYTKIESSREETDSAFLVGYRGALYCVYGDFQVEQSVESFNACGCGLELARGSLFTTRDLNLGARERVEVALRAAEAFSAGVRGPFVIEALEAA